MDYNTLLPNQFKDLKCSICKNYLSYFPIYITINNENICGRCEVPKDSTFLRNKVYEISAQEMLFPCRYLGQGCVEKLTPKNISNHEGQCPLRPVKCPAGYLNLCNQSVSLLDVVQHCIDKHSDLILKNGEFLLKSNESHINEHLVIKNNEVFIFKTYYVYKNNIFSYSVCDFEDHPKKIPVRYKICVKNHIANVVRHGRVGKNPQQGNLVGFSLDVFESNGDSIEGKLNIGGGVQKSTSEQEFEDAFLKLLQCTSCFKYIKPPVNALFAGEKTECLSCAPDCYNDGYLSRHTSFDKIAEKLPYPCKYAKDGCNYKSTPSFLEKHEIYCLHETILCPFNPSKKCDWVGFVTDINSHITKKHATYIAKSSTFDLNLSASDDLPLAKTYLIKFSKYFFRLDLNFDGTWFYCTLQKLLPSEDKFRYELEMFSKKNDYEKIIVSGFCVSSSSEVKVKAGQNGCRFGMNELQHLLNDKHVYFQIRIFKVRTYL